MRTQFRLALATVVALALLVPAASAQEKTGTITGKVTYQGKPLTDGFVNFSTEDFKTSAKINPDGTYRVRRLPVGQVKIYVESKTVAIPKKYAAVKTSGLTYQVKAGQQEHNIELK